MKAALSLVFLLIVCLVSLGQSIRIDRSQLSVSQLSGNATKPGNATTPNKAANATKPAGNATKPTGNATKPKAGNATSPKSGNATKPVSNATKPKANNATASKGSNATKPASANKLNGTKSANGTKSGNATKPTNGTKPVNNATKSGNKTDLDKAIANGAVLQRVMPVPGATYANKTVIGPSEHCPSCQRMRGRPALDYTKTPRGVSFTAGPVEVRTDVDEALVRQVMSVNTGDKVGQSIMSFAKMFVCNGTTLVDGVFPADKRFKTVDFNLKGRDAPYMWTIADPNKSSDNNTAAYGYSVTATPKNKAPGLLRPSIVFDQNLRANENITNSKFDFKVDSFETSYWALPKGGNATHLAVVYTISDVDREGNTHNPVDEHVSGNRAHMNVTVPMAPKVGRDNSGEETLDVTGATVGGLDISGPGYATTANGNHKPVTMAVGKDVDGATAVYFFYERFNASMVHDPYVAMNANIFKSSSATVGIVAAAAITLVAVAMGI
eukprot:TRINITY_DN66034_c0_g1_i1.p1 TRINITY_DN66034_c0_g1~~TRINITY_DN66034_c0_g1_i1.p1  ORF type:complete len:497 (-),score=7.34 TRINITY_DN66034_c0_g1_i1:69-1559(-)